MTIPRHSACPWRARQRGTMLLWVGVPLLVFAGILLAGTESMRAQDASATTGYAVDGQAYAAARAGLSDAVAWMRRNPTQPVRTFAPRLDTEADVPIHETEDPGVGLVRTYEISPGLWARYEVRRGRSMDPFTDVNANGLYDEGEPFVDLTVPAEGEGTIQESLVDLPRGYILLAGVITKLYELAVARLPAYDPDSKSQDMEDWVKDYEKDLSKLITKFEKLLIELAQDYDVPPGQAKKLSSPAVEVQGLDDGYGDGKWTPSLWTREISEERGIPGAGSVWRIESRGLVYHMADESQPLGAGPNRLLAQAWLATEVRRLTISPPADAALCVTRARDVYLGARARVRARELAVAVDSTDGGLVKSTGSEIHAPTELAKVPGYAGDLYSVFGVGWSELRSMADVSVFGHQPETAAQVAPYSLVTIEGDVEFGPGRPLQGKGVVAVRGNMTILEGSTSFFHGVLYVDGDLVIHAPALVSGIVICTGRVELEGSGGDFVDCEHERGILTDLLAVMGQYRVTRAIYTPDGELLDARDADGSKDLLALQGDPTGLPVTDPWADALDDDPPPTDDGKDGADPAEGDADDDAALADWWQDDEDDKDKDKDKDDKDKDDKDKDDKDKDKDKDED